MADQSVGCVHCLSPDGARLRFDKKGRPYAICLCCGSRSFFHAREALAGTLAMAPHLAALLKQRGQTADQYRREILASLDAPLAAAAGA